MSKYTDRYARITELLEQGQSRFYAERYVDMMSKIHGWEKLYDKQWYASLYNFNFDPYEPERTISAVRFLVLEEKRTTRSPGKIDAIEAWLRDNPE